MSDDEFKSRVLSELASAKRMATKDFTLLVLLIVAVAVILTITTIVAVKLPYNL